MARGSSAGAARHRRVDRAAFVAVAALAVAVVLTAALGGFGDVPRQALPTLRPGATAADGDAAITVRSWAVRDTDPLTGAALDQPVVAATVDLRYAGDAPAIGASDWLRPLGLGLPSGSGSFRSVRDGSFGPPVQPGLPMRVVYTWPVPKGSTVHAGDPVRLGVYERYAAVDLPIEGVTTTPVLVAVYEATPS